jgi:trans-aconitate methyltransferase
MDFLLAKSFKNITILDISTKALQRVKNRLGKKGNKVLWVVNDITDFEPNTNCDVWHDGASFHFLTKTKQINKHLNCKKICQRILDNRNFSQNESK